jgi:LEA14-like dessication related protein
MWPFGGWGAGLGFIWFTAIMLFWFLFLVLVVAYSIAKSINVKDYRVAGVGVKEHYSVIPPIPETITLDIILDMENPTGHSIYVSRITYNVYVNKTFVVSGVREGLTIYPGVQSVRLNVDVDLAKAIDLAGVAKELPAKKARGEATTVEIMIRGGVSVPITLSFLAVYIRTPVEITIPYNIEYYYKVS